MSAAQNLPTTNVSLETFWELVATNPDKRLEYRDGFVIEKVVVGSRNRASINANCGTLLHNSLHSRYRVFSSSAHVQIAVEQLYLFDMSVTHFEQPHNESDTLFAPELVVNVISHRLDGIDSLTKLTDSKECSSIRTILLNWQDQRHVEVHERESESLWSVRTLKDAEHYQLRHFPVMLDLDAIYRGLQIGA